MIAHAGAGSRRGETALRRRFEDCLARLGPSRDTTTFAALSAAYRAPDRHYHTIEHVSACLALLDEAAARDAARDEVEIALWFHDAVYDGRRSDNEERSADWAAEVLERVGAAAESVRRVRELILATRHDAAAADAQTSLLVDIDLAVLGAPERDFAAHDAAIRREYDFVAADAYRAGRIALLKSFLGRDRIYRTPYFAARFEAAARRNLTAAISRLETGDARRA
jgi:predicted metal-dependent HD superfamily phosphohydrolase